MDSIERLKLLIYRERDACKIIRNHSIAVGEKYDRIFQCRVVTELGINSLRKRLRLSRENELYVDLILLRCGLYISVIWHVRLFGRGDPPRRGFVDDPI